MRNDTRTEHFCERCECLVGVMSDNAFEQMDNLCDDCYVLLHGHDHDDLEYADAYAPGDFD